MITRFRIVYAFVFAYNNKISIKLEKLSKTSDAKLKGLFQHPDGSQLQVTAQQVAGQLVITLSYRNKIINYNSDKIG